MLFLPLPSMFNLFGKCFISLRSITSLTFFSTKKKKIRNPSFSAHGAEGSAINLNFHMKMAEGLWESLSPTHIQLWLIQGHSSTGEPALSLSLLPRSLGLCTSLICCYKNTVLMYISISHEVVFCSVI